MKEFKYFTILLLFPLLTINAQESRELAVDNPDVIVDLRSKRGVEIVKTEWKYSDAVIVDDQFGAPGPSKDDPLFSILQVKNKLLGI